MATKIYDPDQIVFTFAGIPVSGYADGTFISAAPTGESFTVKQGADGEVTRTKTNIKTWRVTLTLEATSDSNDVLSQLANLDLEEPNGAGVAPLGIADLSGRTIFGAPEAWIVQHPTIEFAKEGGQREWIFDCVDPQVLVGGA